MALRGGAGRPGDRGVAGFTLGSFDLGLLPFDPDAEEAEEPTRPVPRDPDSLRKTMTSTSVHECRNMHDARAQASMSWRQHRSILGNRNICDGSIAASQHAMAASQHRQHRSILGNRNICDASARQVRGPARFRASARPSGALTTVPHITAAQAAGTGCSFGRCQGSCDTCCTIGPPKSSPAVHAAWVCTKPRARVGRHTRGPAYPDIDIGASQTDSALMRGTARCLRRRPPRPAAQPRRCGCVRLGCHMQKFQDPRVA